MTNLVIKCSASWLYYTIGNGDNSRSMVGMHSGICEDIAGNSTNISPKPEAPGSSPGRRTKSAVISRDCGVFSFCLSSKFHSCYRVKRLHGTTSWSRTVFSIFPFPAPLWHSFNRTSGSEELGHRWSCAITSSNFLINSQPSKRYIYLIEW